MAMTVQQELKAQREYSNLVQWNNAGFTGKGINIWNTEGPGDHSEMVDIRIRDAAPECTIVNAGLSMCYDNNSVTEEYCTHNGVQYEIEDFIKKFGINVVTRSVGGGISTGGPESIFWNNLKLKYGLVFFNSAGNEGEDGASGSLPADVASYIAACGLDKYGKPRRDAYSSIGDEVDFCNFRGFYNGTSFAAPYTAGEACVIKQRYGKDMSYSEIFEYLLMISEDMDVAGEDDKTGHGIPRLPDISKKYVTMTVGKNTYMADGKKLTMDTVPVNKEGNVFLPLRALSEALGKTVTATWNADKVTMRIEIKDSKDTIVLNTGSDIMRKNGAAITLNFAPYRDEQGRTMVPLRPICEKGFGCKVTWIQKEAKAMILEQ